MERHYSTGNSQFYHHKGQIAYRDFSLDENGYVRYGFDNSIVAPQRPVSQNSRKWFHLEEDFSTFPLGKINKEQINKQQINKRREEIRKEYWYLFDQRVAIEFYDTNVLIEVNYWNFDEFYTKESFMSKIKAMCDKQNLKYDIVGDLEFINITR